MSDRASFPQYVAIETINTCNARCPFCPLFQGSSMMSRKARPAHIMADELFASAVEQVATWAQAPDSIFLNMNGEPLLDPRFPARLAKVAACGFGARIELQTNGQFLDAKAATAILDAQVGRIVLGFDGATREVHAAHRVRCDYDLVLANLKGFVALRTRLDARTKIAIQYVRTTRNRHEVRAAYEMFAEILDPDLDSFQDDVAKDWGDQPSDQDLFVLKKPAASSDSFACPLFASQMIVQSDGMVAACCWDYNLSVSNGGLGDANAQSLLAIWNGAKRSALAQRLSVKEPDEKPEKCRNCLFLYQLPPLPMNDAQIEDQSLVSISPYGYTYAFPSKARREKPEARRLFSLGWFRRLAG